MGNTDSKLDKKSSGYRIYKLFQEGPLYKAGLRELEDFIIPPMEINEFDNDIREFLIKNLEKEIDLKIYNIKCKKFSYIKVTPSLNWKKSGIGFLGANICYENYIKAEINLLRVLKVSPNTLSHKIELIPSEDYIIGVKPEKDNIIPLNSNNGTDPILLFKNILKTNSKRNIELYIYNSKKGPKEIKLNLAMKINENFGCEVIYGREHEFPLDEISTLSQIYSPKEFSKSTTFTNTQFFSSENKNSSKGEKSFLLSINMCDKENLNETTNTKSISPLYVSKLPRENELDCSLKEGCKNMFDSNLVSY